MFKKFFRDRPTSTAERLVVPLVEPTSNPAFLEQVIKQRDAFIATYNIRAIEKEPSQVARTIPTEKTFADFLREGQDLSIAMHRAFPGEYLANQVISTELFEYLLTKYSNLKGSGLETVTDGCVHKRELLAPEEAAQQTSAVFQRENVPGLVEAFIARYLLDATSIFQNEVVQAEGGLLLFSDNGVLAADAIVRMTIMGKQIPSAMRITTTGT